MNPHEHYKEAEEILQHIDDYPYTLEDKRYLVAAAQVHATLAGVVSWPTEER